MSSIMKYKVQSILKGFLILLLCIGVWGVRASEPHGREVIGVLNSVNHETRIIRVADTKYSVPEGIYFQLLQTQHGVLFNLTKGMKLHLIVEPDPLNDPKRPMFRVKKLTELPKDTPIYSG